MITKYILPIILLASVIYAQSPSDLDPNFIASEVFNQLTEGNSVYTIRQDNQNNIYVGGEFEILNNGHTFKNFIKLKEDGSIDESFLPLTLNASVRDIAIQEDGKVIIAIFGYESDMYTYGNTDVNAIIRLNTDGSLDNTFQFSANTKKFGWKILLLDNGDILASGAYGFFVRLNSTGDIVKDYNPDNSVYSDRFVKDIYLVDNDHLLIGGNFKTYNGQTCKYIAKIKLDGTLDNTFKLSETLTKKYDFGKILLLPDGNILVSVISEYNVSSIIKLKSTGEAYSKAEFETPAPLDNFIYNMAHIKNGEFVATSVANTGFYKKRIFFFKANGSLNTDYNVIKGFDATSFALFVQNDGKILTGGEFTEYNDQPAPKIARLLGSNMSVNSIKNIEKTISVYPNPTHEILYVKNVENNAEYYVFNIEGKSVLKGKLKNKSIDVSNLLKGQYVLSIGKTPITFLIK